MKLHVSKNLQSLSLDVADHLIKKIHEVLKKQNSFSLVLSGGNTPKELYTLLASDFYKQKIDWQKVHIFFGDERFVPLHDERNNARMAFTALLNHVPIPASQIYIIHTENITPLQSAMNYENTIREYFLTQQMQSPAFDLVLLGLGRNAHTLSLFPGQDAIIHESVKWCVSTFVEAQKEERITMTAPIINKASTIYFLVSGNEKAIAMQEILKGKYQPEIYPAQIIHPSNGELYWFADESAVALL